MAFISSANTSSGKGEVHTASVLIANTQVSTASTDVAAASISHDTVCAYIASQSNGSQIKYEDITQIDEDEIKEIDIKASRSQDRGRRESYRQGPKEEEQAPKALMAIGGIGWDWSYMANEEENHALVADDEAPTEFALMAKSSSSSDNEGKDGTGKDVDLHLYRSMIGSLMYLTASRPYITFAVCSCAKHHVTPKECHLHAVKRIFRYLKSHPKLGLWYPKESPFDLVAYSNCDYGGDTQDRKSTTGGCQFLGKRLISWQCKKQTIVDTSTTKAEYVTAASYCGQVLWIQNLLLDYGYNFMNTKIYIDNNNAICIVKNPVYHFKTKHIEIRHHFIRDCFKEKLIDVNHIHTDENVADLLTKLFDAGRF
nr:putative ribonuclease H-like domain-containing protein [Tanacetum cinerariifolium]